MTAATSTLDPPAPSVRSGLALPPGWWRVGAALLVCLPVPLAAASGLTLPLPATVERLAALLVPWADGVPLSANEALPAGARGTIVARAGEAVPARATVLEHVDGGAVVVRLGPVRRAPAVGPTGASAAAARTESGTSASAPAARATTPAAGSTAPAGSAPAQGSTSPGTTSGGDEPAPAPTGDPGPTEVLETAVAPAKPVVEQVVQPVAPVVETVEQTLPPVGSLPELGK